MACFTGSKLLLSAVFMDAFPEWLESQFVTLKDTKLHYFVGLFKWCYLNEMCFLFTVLTYIFGAGKALFKSAFSHHLILYFSSLCSSYLWD